MSKSNKNPESYPRSEHTSQANIGYRGSLKRPWQSSFRKIPPAIESKIQGADDTSFKVASVRDIPSSQVKAGFFDPLNIHFDSNMVLHIPDEGVIPYPESGLWAKRNVEGWRIVRRDLPKVDRYFSVEVPNFGDWARGSHEMGHMRKCYQREFIVPLDAKVIVSLEQSIMSKDCYRISFELDYLFDSSEEDFRKQLLMGINLLQEVAGCADVFTAAASKEEMIESRTVNWEIFPPGVSDKIIVREIIKKHPTAPPDTIIDRLNFLKSLKPEALIRGTNMGTTAYFGAKFADDLVVFENVKHGNAIYVMFDNWEELSKRSRTDLLRNPAGYERIIHRKGWRRKLVRTLRSHLV